MTVLIGLSSRDDVSLRPCLSDLQPFHQLMWLHPNLFGGDTWWAQTPDRADSTDLTYPGAPRQVPAKRRAPG